MRHLAVKATVPTVTDLGEFEALAATWAVDRVKDQIVKGAFANTISAWRASGKLIPLHWAHSGEARNIIGTVDPTSMRETDDGLYVKGKLDLADSEVAREAWRSIKNNAVGLSFGYLTKSQEKRPGGITALLEIDLYEITVAPGPINPDTRFLSLKAATAERRVPTNAELVAQAKALGLEIPLSKAELRKRSDDVALEAALGFEPLPRPEPEPEDPRPTQAELRRKCDMLALEALTDGLDLDASPDPPAKRIPTDAELRAQCKALGFAVPAPRRSHAKNLDTVRAEARDHMLALLRGSDR